MKSLLGALRDGRLVELSATEKDSVLKTLAHLIEAVPEMGRGIDLVEGVMQRERAANSGIGQGVACPHVRVAGNGDLLCSVGWSPQGIEYGAPDGKKVHLIAMYFIPEAQKNAYLKEISALAEAMKAKGDIQSIAKAEDVAAVRDQLLGWVSSALEAGVSQFRARMIHLEQRQAQLEGALAAPGTRSTALQAFPVLFVFPSEELRFVLCENRELGASLEKDLSAAVLARQGATFDRFGFRLLHRATLVYDPARPVHEYIAVRMA